ncbi:MAG: biotin--[acetyl-CoA-carboxylase] ligase [Thermoplasmata archaeon]
MADLLIRRSVVDSTNEEAKTLIAEGAAPWTVVVADKQVAGKGRFGRRWVSPRGGLYLSVILQEALERTPLLSMAASLAVAEALEAWDLPVTVKWPNDVQVGGGKVAGILVEGLVGEEGYWVVVGIGVNSDIPRDKLPKQLDMPATTLRRELGRPVDNEELLLRLLAALRDQLRNLRDPSKVVQAYRDRCTSLGRDVVVQTREGVLRGRAMTIRASGALVLRRPSGEEVEVIDGTVRDPC